MFKYTLANKEPNKDAKEKPRSFGGPARVILFSLLIFIVSQMIAAFLVEFSLVITHPGSSHLLTQSPLSEFFYVLIAEGLAIFLTFKLVRRRGLKPAAIGLGRRPEVRDVWKALAGFAAFYVVLIVAGIILSLFFPNLNFNQKQDVGFNNLNGGVGYLLAFLSLVIIPPLGEEVLIRGYLYSGLRSTLKFIPALIITSLLFGLAHLDGGENSAIIWTAALDTFILSVILVYLREKTGALYAGILVHSLNNLVAFAVHFHG